MSGSLYCRYEISYRDLKTMMTAWRRKPKERVLIHSDQGSQFTAMNWVSLGVAWLTRVSTTVGPRVSAPFVMIDFQVLM